MQLSVLNFVYFSLNNDQYIVHSLFDADYFLTTTT
jgi:hypothetical protein